MYSPGSRSGIEQANRRLLDRLNSEAAGPFTATMAAEMLSLEPPRARRLLAYLAARGWLARVRRGLYTTVPLGASSPSQWREDPWVVAVAAFAPCYIGGWSACEHWGLTEQIFRDIVVITAAPIRERTVRMQDTTFRLKRLPEELLFGTGVVWRAQTRVPVSDASRTLADILDEPRLGGGIRQVSDVVQAYLASEHRDDDRLVGYIVRLGNRAVFKRLGYLLEHMSADAPELVKVCLFNKSAGLTALDPAARRAGTIVKRWNLRVNVTLPPLGDRT